MKLFNKSKTPKTEKEEKPFVPQTGGLRERLARVKKTRWVRFGIVSAIFFAWVAWLGNWWVALAWLLLADIYLTQFIPWNWWKGSKNPVLKTVMSWVDAIVYALVLVYFLFLFVGQNYQIPSSSLEKTLLTGDFLWVNKLVYGPRVPQTPLHFPLAQNTLFGCKSYIEKPQLAYHRLKGLRDVERFDIVVFNFPAGDTVATKVPNPDYYRLVFELGRDVVHADKQQFGDVIWRPVDRRDAYVKRCIALPGERLKIEKGIIYIDGKALPTPEYAQFNYALNTGGTLIDDQTFDDQGVSGRHVEEQSPEPGFEEDAYRMIHADDGCYHLPLTKGMKEFFESMGFTATRESDDNPEIDKILTYPLGVNYGWTHDTYAQNVKDGGIWVPKKGVRLNLTPYNLPIYLRCIKNYEGNDVELQPDGTILINGKPATSYVFKMNYYWMMGDNRDNSSDSRYWGFVPEDHIIGTPMFVIVSFDKDRKWFHGKIRWNRVFTDANPDK